MVAVNDQILLRRPFSFKKNESRSVLGSFTVPSGAATIKAWLSGPGLPAAAFATTSAQISGGETRTLRLDYTGGKLAVQLQWSPSALPNRPESRITRNSPGRSAAW